MTKNRKFDERTKRLSDKYNKDKTTLNDRFTYKNRQESVWSKDFSMYNLLPFVNKNNDFGVWLYNKRVGIISVSVVYLILLFIVLSVKYDITPQNSVERIFIDVAQEVIIVQKKEEEVVPKVSEEMVLQPDQQVQPQAINNYIIDQNIEGGSEDTDLFDEEGATLHENIESLEQSIRANQESYQKGLALIEEREMERRRLMEQDKTASNKNKLKGSSLGLKRGNVTVSYDLIGRTALELEVPAYRCEGGGKVVVDITVSYVGEVIDAKINNTQGVTDDCVPEKALEAARKSLFSSSHGLSKQYGTITYMFIAQ